MKPPNRQTASRFPWSRTFPLRPAWLVFFSALALALAAGYVDQRLKAAPHPGFTPESVTWRLSAEDFPAFWAEAARTPEGKEIAAHAGRYMSELALRVRLAAGIRPTPERWRVWMGPALLAGAGEEGAGLCVRPGLVMRAAHGVNRLAGGRDGDGSLYRFGAFHYAWRDGFLIVADSAAYVEASLAAPPYESTLAEPRAATLTWTAAPSGSLTWNADSGWPFQGEIALPLAEGTTPLTLPGTPPFALEEQAADAPVLAMAWRDAAPAAAWASALAELTGLADAWRELDPDWRAHFLTSWDLADATRDWPGTAGELGVLAYAPLWQDGLPAPRAAVMLRGGAASASPPLRLWEAPSSIAYAWGPHEGWMRPYLGSALTACAAAAQGDWIMTTQEPLMARLLAARRGESRAAPDSAGADAVLRVDLRKLAQALRAALLEAASRGWLPRMDARAAEHAYLPALEALGSLGRLEAEGHAHGTGTRFMGRFDPLTPRSGR